MTPIFIISVSAIIPALNEAQNIRDAVASTLKAFNDLNIDGEVVVVNDGSTDETGMIADKLASGNPAVKVLHHEHPMGVGRSYRDGVNAATKSAVVYMPGDNENDPYEVLQHARQLEQVDMVVPNVSNKDVRSRLRRLYSWLYLQIINATFRTHFNYTNGNVIYSMAAVKKAASSCDSFFFQTDALVRATRAGCKFIQVSIRIRGRPSGSSKALTLRSLRTLLCDYLRLVRDVYWKRSL